MASYTPISFAPIVYPDWGDLFDGLPDDQCAQLLKAIAHYPEYEPPQGNIAWKFIKGQLDKQYQKFLERTQKAKASRQCGTTNVDERRPTSTENDERQQKLTEVDHKPIPEPVPKPKPVPELESVKSIYTPSAEPSACVSKSKPKKKKVVEDVKKPEDVEQADWDVYLRIRKQKNLPLTDRAVNLLRTEGKKAGMTLQQVIVRCCEKGWAGFEAEWVAGQKQTQPPKKNIFLVNHKDEQPEEKEIVPSRDEDEWDKAQPYVKEALAKYGC